MAHKLILRLIGLLWVGFGLLGVAFVSETMEPVYWLLTLATALFFGGTALLGYRLLLGKRFALALLSVQALIIALVFAAGIFMADVPGGGGASAAGWGMFALAIVTVLLGLAHLAQRVAPNL